VADSDQLAFLVPGAEPKRNVRRTRLARPPTDGPRPTAPSALKGTAPDQHDLDWRPKDVVSVPFAGMHVLGLSRQGSYDAASRGEIPTIRVGRRILVPVIPLRRLLGESV
jgi:hypothetical protein